MDKQEEIRKNHPEFTAYLDNTEIFLEAEYRLGPIKICVVPNIDFTQKMFEPLFLNMGDAVEMTAFSNEKIMPVVFNAINLFYNKNSDEVEALVVGNSLFTQLFIVDEVTDGVKRALRMVTAKDDRDLIPFQLNKAGFCRSKRDHE